jgi:hypothetical protein
MNMQPALDQINAECRRRGLDWANDAEVSWYEAGGDAIRLEAVFPDGTIIEGYAPRGMVDIRESIVAARPKLTLVDGVPH